MMSNFPTTMPAPTRARMQTLEAVQSATGMGFDPDAWHVIEQRDNALIADEVLNGSGSNKFVYQFDVGSTAVAGISVVGARHLASFYGGIKHRLVASVQKIGALHTFTSYPAAGMPMSVQCAMLHELTEEDDYYGTVVEVTDIKTGNMIQVEKRETRMERRRDGSLFERPHYAVIAQSKAYRNAVLALIPQDTQMKFKQQMLALGKGDVITAGVMEEKRAGVLRFAAAKGLRVDRRAVEELTMGQITGLSDAARTGLADFSTAAQALGVMEAVVSQALPAAATAPGARKLPGKAAPSGPPPPVPQAGELAQGPAAANGSPAPESLQDDGEPFGSYLVDDVGEMVEDEYTHPVTYARALGKVWQALAEPGRVAVLQNNAEGIMLAVRSSDEAASIIRDLQVLTPMPGQGKPGANQEPDRANPDAVAATVPVTNAKGVAWAPTVKALRDGLGSVGAGKLEAWAAANLPTIREAPDMHRLVIVKAVHDHAAAVGGRVPDSIQQAVAKPAAAEAVDWDAKWADTALETIAAAADDNAVMAFAQSTATVTKMTRLQREKLALFNRVDAAIVARRGDFKGGEAPAEA